MLKAVDAKGHDVSRPGFAWKSPPYIVKNSGYIMHQADRTPVETFDTHKCVTLKDACSIYHYTYSPFSSSQSMGKTNLCLSNHRQCRKHGHFQTHAIWTNHGTEKNSTLLHNAFFARHIVHIRPTSQDNKTLLFTNFKMKTIKNFLGRRIEIPTRIRHALHRFTTHVPLPAQTVVNHQVHRPQDCKYYV